MEEEIKWRQALPQYTPAELLEIFPEARAIIPKKIVEWKRRRNVVIKNLHSKITQIRTVVEPENQWLYLAFLKHLDGMEVMRIDRHLARLARLRAVGFPKSNKQLITASMIASAQTVSTVEILEKHVKLRKSGRRFIAVCFLHNDHRPSFVVYPDTHSWYCFGCHVGGGNIALVRKLFNYSFQEAVHYLNKF